LPQWNCTCANCTAARTGQIAPRTQSSVAITADHERWFLINASPDLREQIEGFAPLLPSAASPRNTPIAGVLLTNADLDHTIGLLLLRQQSHLKVHAPPSVRETLGGMRFDTLLSAFATVEWIEPPREWEPLSEGLRYRAIPLQTVASRFALDVPAECAAYQIEDARTGRKVVIAPAVAEITPVLYQAMRQSDAVLFDGTFWTDDELRAVKEGARSANEMGHLPIKDGSLEVLRELAAPHRVYMHINNTNPILAPGSPERVSVERAGITVGEDGMELAL
jgi:pyrroloquinoline quinone biosynthesis protein B